MKIDELLEKREARQLAIVRQTLLAGGHLSYTSLTSYLNVSKASLEKDIYELGYVLRSVAPDCVLSYDGQVITLNLAETFSLHQLMQRFIIESLKFQLLDYLYRYQEFSSVQLTTKFMISESSLFRKIKELNYLLAEFGLQIKNGQLVGEELQIRYFYFQLYWYVSPYEQHIQQTMTQGNKRIIEALEKSLKTRFHEHSSLKLSLWLTIAKRRLPQGRKDYHNLQEKIAPLQEDPLYITIRQFVLRFFNHSPLEFEEGEAMLHFAFLLAMSVFPEPAFSEYVLLRGRRSLITLADTFVLENVVLYYRPQKFEPALEKTLLYYFSQIHSRLYFMQGELEIFDQDNIWAQEKNLSSHQLTTFSRQLLKQGLTYLGENYLPDNSLHELSLIKYLSVLAMIDFKLLAEVHVAIDLAMDQLYGEVLAQVLLLNLKSLNGTIVETYQPNKTYALIITNYRPQKTYSGNPEIYVLSEVGSAYDIQQLKIKIRSLRN